MDKILKNVDSLDEELDELLKRTTSICQVKAALSAVVMHQLAGSLGMGGSAEEGRTGKQDEIGASFS